MSLSKQNQLKEIKGISHYLFLLYTFKESSTHSSSFICLNYRHYTASNSAKKYVPGVSCNLLDTTKTHVNLLVLYIHIF